MLLIPTPGLPGGHPLYVRFCGPAEAVAHLDGGSFQLRGGQCTRDNGGGFLIRIGMIANAPALPFGFVGLFLHRSDVTHTGTFRLAETAKGTVYATIQLPHRNLPVAGGTITIGKAMTAGTFALRLHNATRVTGTWACRSSQGRG
jgi:hypothetical protein